VRAVAYSPHTGEEYSASPGDYWQHPPEEPLRDEVGEPMLLVVATSGYVDAMSAQRQPEPGPCQWFALCENQATGRWEAPALRDIHPDGVPICDRCAAKLDRIEAGAPN
jgi:hypothetical protein